MSESQVMISFMEDESIFSLLKEQAAREGTTRTAILRRALRRELLLLPPIPTSGNPPPKETKAK